MARSPPPASLRLQGEATVGTEGGLGQVNSPYLSLVYLKGYTAHTHTAKRGNSHSASKASRAKAKSLQSPCDTSVEQCRDRKKVVIGWRRWRKLESRENSL